MSYFLMMMMLTISAFAANGRDGILKMREGFCVCKDGRSASYGNCASYCANQNTNGADILSVSFSVAENKKYQSVAEWCSKKSPWDFRNPKCVMSFVNEEGQKTDLEAVVAGNGVKVDVTSIDYDKVNVMTLVESVSKGKSDSAQLLKYDSEVTLPIPVQTSSLTQFTCLSKPMQKKYHFYFAPYLVPNPQGAGSPFVCHDVVKYGSKDDALFPRFEEVSAAIGVWPNTSPLFYDNDANGYMDVHDAIRRQMKRFGSSIPMGTEFFTYFTLPGDEQNYAQSGAAKNSSAYVLKPFIDQNTFYSFCPGETHYNSTTPLFRALKEVIASETEGLYAAVEISDSQDVILLNEKNIKAVWFYVKDGQIKVPNDSNVSRQTIYFYYPLDKVNPYVKKPNQKIYQVKSAEEIGMSTGNTYPSHDRKIACIPKI